MKWDASFRLAARDGFEVACEISGGSVRIVEVYSKLGKECIIRNNFGRTVTVETEDGEITGFSGEYIRFQTASEKRYIIR